jgi:hypothetical protein
MLCNTLEICAEKKTCFSWNSGYAIWYPYLGCYALCLVLIESKQCTACLEGYIFHCILGVSLSCSSGNGSLQSSEETSKA